MIQYKDDTLEKIEKAKNPPVVTPPLNNNGGSTEPPAPTKVYKTLNRSIVFPAKKLESEAEIDEYVEKIRETLYQLMNNCDGIKLK